MMKCFAPGPRNKLLAGYLVGPGKNGADANDRTTVFSRAEKRLTTSTTARQL